MSARLRIRIALPQGHIGPGKIALLEQIEALGSITAGAKAMGMTYRRAWHLLETLQKVLNENVIETATGGKKGGGAKLTPLGRELCRLYRETEQEANKGAIPLLEKVDDLLVKKDVADQ